MKEGPHAHQIFHDPYERGILLGLLAWSKAPEFADCFPGPASIWRHPSIDNIWGLDAIRDPDQVQRMKEATKMVFDSTSRVRVHPEAYRIALTVSGPPMVGQGFMLTVCPDYEEVGNVVWLRREEGPST